MRAPEFWAEDGTLPMLLAPLGAGYDLAGRLRRSLISSAAVPVPVICVGNLVAGGAGKTPLVLALVAALGARGCQAHCLTRGYRGREGGPLRVDLGQHDARRVGDEALLLAKAAPTWVGSDRVAGARAAAAAGADAIVMDDGYQNPSLAKDLSFLAVDGAYGFGNARVIPAGPLRETLCSGLARADALVLFGDDRRGLESGLRESRLPILHARLRPGPTGDRLAGRRVLAFAGIGRPEKFFESLESLGAELVERRAFPDHHPYTRAELEELLARAAVSDLQAVTTEKDAVRLPPALRDRIEVLGVSVAFREPATLETLLDRVFDR